jgi:hypothetical protein
LLYVLDYLLLCDFLDKRFEVVFERNLLQGDLLTSYNIPRGIIVAIDSLVVVKPMVVRQGCYPL